MIAAGVGLGLLAIGYIVKPTPGRGNADPVGGHSPELPVLDRLKLHAMSEGSFQRQEIAIVPQDRVEASQQALEKIILLETEEERNDALEIFLTTLDAGEAKGLMQCIQALDGSVSIKDEILYGFLRAWVRADSAAAVAWVEELPEWQRDGMRDRVCHEMAFVDPLGALEMARESGVLEKNPGMVENVAQIWATRNPAEALSWAKSLPTGEQRDEIFSRIACVQAEREPEKAAVLVLSEIAPGSNQDEAVMTVVHQWALKDIPAARRWVESFPASPLRVRAVAELEGIAKVRAALAGK